MEEKYLMIWPKSKEVKHINYHFSQFGEYITYLEERFPNKVVYRDGDINGEYGYHNDSEIIELIQKENIKKIVMHISYENAGNSKNLIEKIKEKYPNVFIMGYGTVPRLHLKLFENIPIDALACSGHDQKSIESFLKDYKKDEDISVLKGLKVRKKGSNQFIETSSGEYIENYEWTITPNTLASAYYEENNHVRYVINVSTGCPFNCEHCLLQLTEGKIERRRTIENIDESLSMIEKDYPYIEFFAANLTLDQKYVLALCKMIREKHPNITWGCATRIDEVTRTKSNKLLMDDADLLKIMGYSGCSLIGLGVEGITGNLNSIHTKDFAFEKTNQAIANIQEAGITAKAMIMVRIPNQTRQDIINTFYYLTKMKTFIRPTLYTPYHKIEENNISIYDLYKYNRKKRPDDYESPVKGISNEQFDELLKNPKNYLEILNCSLEEIQAAEEITGIPYSFSNEHHKCLKLKKYHNRNIEEVN